MNNRNGNLTAEFKASEKTQRAFCNDRGISIHTLRYHLYKKGNRRLSAHASPKATPVSTVPAFLSFNSGMTAGKLSPRRFTIIHGTFSITDIAELLSGVLQS